MRPDSGPFLIGCLLIAFGGPLLLGLAGFIGRRAPPTEPPPAWDWRLSAASALLYVLAFNTVFFVQELFLVLPKAFTPGLEPVLYHNNHGWEGEHPLARLFQGTGALAILILGLAGLAALKSLPSRRPALRLFVLWTAFSGTFQSLPQVIAGAVLPGNDVGMAMDYLRLDPPAMRAAAVAALAAMALAGTALSGRVLEFARDPAELASRGRRTALVFRAAVLPATLGTLLVLPFRAPGSLDQVVLVPVAVALLGLAWLLAGAWRAAETTPAAQPRPALLVPAVLLLLQLAVFQLVLRPGIAF